MCPDHRIGLRCGPDACDCERGHRFPVRGGVPYLAPSDLAPPSAEYVRWIRDYYRVPFSSRQRRLSDARWRMFLGLTDPPLPVLDVGCGRAERSRAFPSGSYVGVDPIDPVAAGMVAALAAPMVVGRGERLPFKDGQFGSVMLWAVLDHVADRAALIDECARVLRIGGRLCVMTEVVAERGGTLRGVLGWILSRLRTGDLRGMIAVARFTFADPRSRSFLTPLTADVVRREVSHAFADVRTEIDDGHALLLRATR